MSLFSRLKQLQRPSQKSSAQLRAEQYGAVNPRMDMSRGQMLMQIESFGGRRNLRPLSQRLRIEQLEQAGVARSRQNESLNRNLMLGQIESFDKNSQLMQTIPDHIDDPRKRALFIKIMDRRERMARHLYKTENIIGYTGNIDDNPTVYYRRPSGTFGHITQDHKYQDNIGRENARNHPGYTFGNTGPGGRLEEKINGKVIHPSRNPFVPLSRSRATRKEEVRKLRTAHHNFPIIKNLYYKKEMVHQELMRRMKLQ